MKENLKSIKVTDATIENFNLAAVQTKKFQYEVAEEASKDILKKISAKIKSTKKQSK